MIFEGEYLNGEKNGKINEFEYDGIGKLAFEGEYLNGKRNGKGKEIYYLLNERNYCNSVKFLVFKGEYLNGKKWNGEVYDMYNYSKFELKNGKGFFREYIKEYNRDSILIFEGVYINGEKNGKGYEYLINNTSLENIFTFLYYNNRYKKKEDISGHLIFEGEYINGEKNGKGYEYYDNSKLFFEGKYLNGKK